MCRIYNVEKICQCYAGGTQYKTNVYLYPFFLMQVDFPVHFSLIQRSIYSYIATTVVLVWLLKTESATTLDCGCYHHCLSWYGLEGL